MFGLFKNTYDYYEWHDLVCVSQTKEKLEKHYKEIEPNQHEKPILYGDEQKIAADCERVHYTIEPVLVV